MASKGYLKKTLAFEACTGTSKGFIDSLLVWINKPHVVNRRLCGSRLEIAEKTKRTSLSGEYIRQKLLCTGFEFNTEACVEFDNEVGKHNETELPIDASNAATKKDDVNLSKLLEGMKEDEVVLIIRQMLPKQPERHANIPELILLGMHLTVEAIS